MEAKAETRRELEAKTMEEEQLTSLLLWLSCYLYYTAHAHLPRNNTARSGLDLPPNTYIKIMACSHVHRIV